MHRKLFSLFLTLLLVGALAALAQSPTSSAPPGGSETKDPYGATLDHPNPGSPNPARTAPAPMTTTEPTTAATPPASTTTETTTTTATPPATSTYNSSTTTSDTTATGTTTTPSTTADSKSLPRTASDLPLLVIIGLLALGGALTVRSIARRDA
jgi:cobalamin biosynthesis Mg chelatase CobN